MNKSVEVGCIAHGHKWFPVTDHMIEELSEQGINWREKVRCFRCGITLEAVEAARDKARNRIQRGFDEEERCQSGDYPYSPRCSMKQGHMGTHQSTNGDSW